MLGGAKLPRVRGEGRRAKSEAQRANRGMGFLERGSQPLSASKGSGGAL